MASLFTVGDWMSANGFIDLCEPLSEVLGIASSDTTESLCILSSDDLSDFFEVVSSSYPSLSIPLKSKITFKRKILQLSQAMDQNLASAPAAAASAQGMAQTGEGAQNESIFRRYESYLSTHEKQALLQFENSEFQCANKLSHELPNLLKLNANRHALCQEKLAKVMAFLSDSVLTRDTFESCRNGIETMQRDHEKLSHQMARTRQNCLESWQWRDEGRDRSEKQSKHGSKHSKHHSSRGKNSSSSQFLDDCDENSSHTPDAMLSDAISAFGALSNEYEEVTNQFNQSYRNFDALLQRIQHTAETHQMHQKRNQMAQSQDIRVKGANSAKSFVSGPNQMEAKFDADVDDYKYARSREGSEEQPNGRHNYYQKHQKYQERPVRSEAANMGKYAKKTSGGYGSHASRQARNKRMYFDANGSDSHWSQSQGSLPSHGTQGTHGTHGTQGHGSRHGRGRKTSEDAIFSIFNAMFVKNFVFPPHSQFVQRLMFCGNAHAPRMVVSDIGFSRGRHVWSIRLRGENPSSRCRIAEPFVQIGVMQLDLNKFMSDPTDEQNDGNYGNYGDDAVRPKFVTETDGLHFYSKQAVDLGFGLRYYLAWNEHNNTMALGTMGNKKDRSANFFVDLDGYQWDGKSKKEKKRLLKQKVGQGDSNHPQWDFGDFVSMELDCDEGTLKFWYKDKELIGENVDKKQFNRGVIALEKGQTYYPALCCIDCDCDGHNRGFVLETIRNFGTE